MCKFCDGSETVMKFGIPYAKLTEINQLRLNYDGYSNDSSFEFSDDSVEIKFCPFCGRELRPAPKHYISHEFDDFVDESITLAQRMMRINTPELRKAVMDEEVKIALNSLQVLIGNKARKGVSEFSIHFPFDSCERDRDAQKIYQWHTFNYKFKNDIIIYLKKEKFNITVWHKHIVIRFN